MQSLAQSKIQLPQAMPGRPSNEEESKNYWDVYNQWKAIAFSISLSEYNNLDDVPRNQIKQILLKYETMGIPMTPRLASMAISEKRNAMRQVEALNLKQAQKQYVPDGSENFGVGTIVGGKNIGVIYPTKASQNNFSDTKPQKLVQSKGDEMVQEVNLGKKLSADQAAELKKAFDNIDTDQDGEVTKDILIMLLKGLGEEFTDEVVE